MQNPFPRNITQQAQFKWLEGCFSAQKRRHVIKIRIDVNGCFLVPRFFVFRYIIFIPLLHSRFALNNQPVLLPAFASVPPSSYCKSTAESFLHLNSVDLLTFDSAYVPNHEI